MEKRVEFPKDEFPHKHQAIEWWYFNGFLRGKHNYAFMTCLFNADVRKVHLSFLKSPYKEAYFSHLVLYNLDTKKIKKEVIPIVFLTEDSLTKKELFLKYYFPLRKDNFEYEISKNDKNLKLKTRFFDLSLTQNKRPLLENGTGYMDLGKKSTYYYSYTDLDVKGKVGSDLVTGKAWHDRQWSTKGFMKDSWIWFSIQMPNNTEIFCLDYLGQKFAAIVYPDGTQEDCDVKFKPLGNTWKSPLTDLVYELEWEIHIKDMIIKTKALLKKCEVNFGSINYWEGPIDVSVNGTKANGFMELLPQEQPSIVTSFIRQGQKEILKKYRHIKRYFNS